MLTPDQIIPFVTHEDPLVREHVVQYFDKPSTYGPLTAEHYWQAIDRFGMEESRRFLTHLEDVPQTNASVARLLAMLRDKPSERVRHDLQQTAGKIEFNLLRAHRENEVFHQVPTLSLLDGLRAVNLKLWDPESGKLVSFARARRAGAHVPVTAAC